MKIGDKTFDLKMVMSWNPCYHKEKISEMFGDNITPTLFEVLETDRIIDDDKFWLVLRNHFFDNCDLWMMAAAFAEQQLHLFEKLYPDDKRLRNAIKTVRLFAFDEVNAAAAAGAAAGAAARAATWNTARVAARKKQLEIVKIYANQNFKG